MSNCVYARKALATLPSTHTLSLQPGEYCLPWYVSLMEDFGGPEITPKIAGASTAPVNKCNKHAFCHRPNVDTSPLPIHPLLGEGCTSRQKAGMGKSNPHRHGTAALSYYNGGISMSLSIRKKAVEQTETGSQYLNKATVPGGVGGYNWR